jgi:excisionase family DNA binding protein
MTVLDDPKKKKRRTARRFPPLKDRNWYTIKEAAKRLQVSPVGVNRWIADGVLPATRPGPLSPWRLDQKLVERIAEYGYDAVLAAPPPVRWRQPGNVAHCYGPVSGCECNECREGQSSVAASAGSPSRGDSMAATPPALSTTEEETMGTTTTARTSCTRRTSGRPGARWQAGRCRWVT